MKSMCYCYDHRRGSTYIVVMSAALLVTLLGLGAMAAVRVQRRSIQVALESIEARSAAQSAVQLGLSYVFQDPNWRSTRSNGQWLNDVSYGPCRIDLQATDPQDGDLQDSEYDPLVLTGTGRTGPVRQRSRVTLIPEVETLTALKTCIHASGDITVNESKQLTALFAPVSTNHGLDNNGLLDGNAEMEQVITLGNITGSSTVGSGVKPMPSDSLFAYYQAKASAIVFLPTLEKIVITPDYNPLGVSNAEGVYFIDTLGNNLTIKRSRVEGTLVINATGNKCTLDNSMFMQPFNSAYPVLIVKGDLELKCHSADYFLSEPYYQTNFNPPWAPYQGQSDLDLSDEYPNEIRGLIHVYGNVTMTESAKVVGAVISHGTVDINGINVVIHDPSLYTSPPEGYTQVNRMKIAAASWVQVVD